MDRVVPEGQLGNNLLASQKMTWTYENDAYSKEPTMVKEKNPTRNR